MKKISQYDLIERYDEVSSFCHSSRDIVQLENDLIVMSIEVFERREKELVLKEKLFEVELARLNGAKDYSLEELDASLKDLLNL